MTNATPLVALVPTFRPDPSLIDLVDLIGHEVAHVLVSDDASPCTSDPVLASLSGKSAVMVIRHGVNRGIARGLNDGLHFAHSLGATWLLTIDQDSNPTANYIPELLAQANQRVESGENLGAIGAHFIRDTNGDMRYPERGTIGHRTTEEIIQTGTLWSVPVLITLGGFDESLGIDAVDAAACLALRQHGFTIGLADNLALDHRIGDSRTLPLGRRRIMITGHSPTRRATMVSNRLRLFPAEFRQSPRHALRTMRRVVVNQSLGLIIEKDRAVKLRGTIHGLRPQRNR